MHNINQLDTSIIIVNWNSGKYITNCINSIFKMIRNISYEIIVVDNNSTDDSVIEIKRLFPGIKLLVNSTNLGFSEANNIGARIANSSCLLFLNPDTIIKDGAVDRLYRCINEYDACGPKLIGENGKIQFMCARSFPSIVGTIYNMFLLERLFPNSRIFGKNLLSYWDHFNSREVDCLSGACIMIRKEVFERISGFDESYLFYGEDLDLCYRVKKNGGNIYYCSEAEIIHYGKGSTERSNNNGILYEVVLFYSTKHYFRLNGGVIKYIEFNMIAAMASLFRIIMILLIGPLLKFSERTEYSKSNIKKYWWIFLLATGLIKFDSFDKLFVNSNVK